MDEFVCALAKLHEQFSFDERSQRLRNTPVEPGITLAASAQLCFSRSSRLRSYEYLFLSSRMSTSQTCAPCLFLETRASFTPFLDVFMTLLEYDTGRKFETYLLSLQLHTAPQVRPVIEESRGGASNSEGHDSTDWLGGHEVLPLCTETWSVRKSH